MRYSKVSTGPSLIWLVSLTAIATASGQGQTATLNPNEPLEKYDMPPAYIYRLETSPRMVSPYAGFTSYQVNVNANHQNIVGDAANEPSIAVDPTNSSRMTIGWRQFDTWTSNFRQGGWGYTTDVGVTWTFPGVLEPGVFRSDPVLNSNEIGTFFYLSLLQTFCDNIYRSTNGGQSWLELQPDGNAGGGDKEWFTIDKTNGIGHGFQYQAWSPAAACTSGLFNRSTDGGVTWQAPLSLPNSAHWGTLDVATNGNLFIGGGNGGSSFWCIRSSNAQNGNQTPTFDQVTTVNMGGSMVSGSVNPGGLIGQIFLAVDRSGSPTSNNIYMLCSVRPPSYSNGTDVMIARSTNGGASFSTPVKINDDATTNKWHWFGTFSVAPNGRLDAVWYDTRNDSGNLLSQLFYSYSTNGGVTWAPNIAVSQPFDPTQGWPNQDKIGDYITIVSDNTGGNVAYSATFNFNPSRGQHEQDIYYVRVSPSGGGTPTPTPTPTATRTPTATPTATRTPTPTPTAAPGVTTNPATNVASFSATLNGTVNPHGLTTTVHFQYGTTTSYGLTTTPQTKTGNTFQAVSARISGLSASTTYHFRMVATNSAGTTFGIDRTFTTLSATGRPVVTTNPATFIASFSARLNGSVDPHGLSTTVYFQYGTTTSYGVTSSSQTKTGNTYQNVVAGISGLSASTTYHFRIVATNSAGTTYGADQIFATLSATGPPLVIANGATNVTSSSATLNATVDPHGLTTSVHFQYGTTTSYGSTTPSQSKTGNTFQTASADISGLSANTTYHFRLVATNSAGTTYGSDRTFTTP
jgi:hypothetical protein